MRLYALVQAGDPEAIDVFLSDVKRVLEELVLATFLPRTGKLELVEDPELHLGAAYR